MFDRTMRDKSFEDYLLKILLFLEFYIATSKSFWIIFNELFWVEGFYKVAFRVWFKIEIEWRIIKGVLSCQNITLKTSCWIFYIKPPVWSVLTFTLLIVIPINKIYPSILNLSWLVSIVFANNLYALPKTNSAKLFYELATVWL